MAARDTTDTILAAAARLPVRARARVTERLLASLDGPPDADAAEAWAAEIARRSREIERGTVRGVPWADVRAAGAARRARGRR